ncbi:MAG: HD domain-containing protein [Desulfovibrio sp.]|nr:HD domain-containing protein [Desulfovibrio sp.]
MIIRLWGTRGSIPVSSPHMARFGGATACIEVLKNSGERLILDAGSGIHALGDGMSREVTTECAICITHLHWDHIMGLTCFAPLYDPAQKLTLYGAAAPKPFAQSIRGLFEETYFPVPWESLPQRDIVEFTPGGQFSACGMTVKTCPTGHPGGCTAFRVEADGWSFVYTGDHECGDNAATTRLLDFMAGADVALVDGHYFLSDYETHRGWGHSAIEHWPEALAQRGVKHCIFTHHAPTHTDSELQNAINALRDRCRHLPITLQLAREGMRITAEGGVMEPGEEHLKNADAELFDFFQRISHFSDINLVLDNILEQARSLTLADAGTIYLVEDNHLVFSYTANDTLFPGSEANKHIYLKSELPIDTKSIAGFVACTGRALNIPDVRAIAESEPYAFNESFDKATGYRTVSMLTLPFADAYGRLLGVLQLINSTYQGRVRPFTPGMVQAAGRLGMLAVTALDRANMANDLILRMLRTTSLRDPRETAGHVRRVGAMAAEIYHRWAEKHGVRFEELRTTKGRMRMAAMLHDVGTVGIPDAILKKNGRLTPEERAVMETHTAMGADLFTDARADVDRMARDIALHHHQKWNGQGYTGSDRYPLLAGEAIPLAARITAIADVYDALISRRCYKEPWPTEKAVAVLQEDAGTHFDPELVQAFMEIRDVIDAICKRFAETDA